MPCGCGKKSTRARTVVASGAAPVTSITTYDVVDNSGNLIGSYTSIVMARTESRRTGGSVVPRTIATS